MPPTLKQRQVKTKRQSDQHATPRLPHERDEAEDSQESGGNRDDMRQAYADVQKGLQDTDMRGSLGSTNVADAPQKLPAGISGNPPDHTVKKPPRSR